MKELLKRLTFFIPRSILGITYFELRSFVGRLVTPRLYLKNTQKHLLNLGCGPVIAEGFINIDFFWSGADYGADLRYPLEIDDSQIDGIFSEHTLEHLTYDQNSKLLAECFRVLKPGGRIRVSVPDVSIFVENYAKNNRAWFQQWERFMFIESNDPERARRRLISPMTSISFITQEYFHQSAWDFETMAHFLRMAGFAEVEACSFRQGKDPQLLIDLDDRERRLVSLYVEAVKPVI